jgi:hypothetical protein
MLAVAGGFKSNVSPLIAEQQRHKRHFIRVKRNGERVIVDPAMTTARIYMVSLSKFSLLPQHLSLYDASGSISLLTSVVSSVP